MSSQLCFFAGLVAYPSWIPSLEALSVPGSPPIVITDFCEEALVKSQVVNFVFFCSVSVLCYVIGYLVSGYCFNASKKFTGASVFLKQVHSIPHYLREISGSF